VLDFGAVFSPRLRGGRKRQEVEKTLFRRRSVERDAFGQEENGQRREGRQTEQVGREGGSLHNACGLMFSSQKHSAASQLFALFSFFTFSL